MPLFPAVKCMDSVIGVDIHAVAPIPGIPVHPYAGPVYLWSTPVFPSTTVLINGMPACSVGALGYFPHVPQGVPVPPTPTNQPYWKRYRVNVPMVLTLTGLTILANLAIAGISSLLPKNKTVEHFIKDVTGIDTSSRAATWQTIKGSFQAYSQWQTWAKLLMPPLPYPGAQGSVAVGSPNVTVNGGPLAFVGPLMATSCSDIPVVPNAVTLGFSNVLVGVSFADLLEGIAAQAARAGIQHGLNKGMHGGEEEEEPGSAPAEEGEETPPAKQQNDNCGRPGEPIDPVTGASESEFVDYQQPGVFVWERCDSSAWCQDDGPLGYGVRHSYQRTLLLQGARAAYVDHRRRRFEFRRDARGQWRGMLGYTLRNEDDQRFVLRHADHGILGFERDPVNPARARLAGWLRGPIRDALTYDEKGRLAAIRQRWTEDGKPQAAAYLLRYDSSGRVVGLDRRTAAGEESLVAYEYDRAGRLVAARNAIGATRRFVHDTGNRIIRRCDANGYSFHFLFDDAGRCIESGGQDRLWHVRLQYAPGRTLVTQSDNGLWVYSYDAAGTITEVLDPYGGRARRITDPDGRVLREIDSGGRVMQRLYEKSGRHTGRRDRWGNVWPTKDEAPRLPNPLAWRLPRTPYAREWGDENGALEGLPLPPWVATHLPAPALLPPAERLDALGRMIERRNALGHVERTAYTETGRIACVTDPDGQDHRREYASWNLCVACIDPRGATTRYRYTRREKVAAIIDPNGNESRYIYDCKDRLTHVFRHGELREAYRYDVGDRLVAKDDAEGRPLLRMEIGSNGVQCLRELASGDTHTYAYDAFGNVTEASTGSAKVEIPHTGGRRTGDLRDGRGITHRWRNGLLAETTYFGQFAVRYEALAPGDALIHLPAGKPIRLQMTKDGSVLRCLGNGTNELSRFDPLGRCTGRLAWRSGENEPAWLKEYAYSGTGELLRTRHSRLGTVVNHYDAAHAIVEQVRADRVFRYSYDAAGNVLSTPARPELRIADGNRLIESATERFVYNARGHLAGILHTDGRRTAFEYDSADMLVRITGGVGFAEWTAEYDGIGRRTAKTVDGLRTEYFWDGHRLAAEEAAGGALRLYVYPTPSALVPVAFIDYASAKAEPATGRACFVFHDQVGLPELIEDSRGGVAWRALSAEPYARIAVAPESRLAYHLRFPGHYYDPETGLFCNRFRYFSPDLARYLQSDPIGQAGGVNLYAYPANPLVDVDLLGLHPPTDNKEEPASPEENPVSNGEKGPSKPDQATPPSATPGSQSGPNGRPVLPANPDDLLAAGYAETSHPDAAAEGHRTFVNPDTGDTIRFDQGRPGATGFEGTDHYHQDNPDATSKMDTYLDKDGNPVPRGSKASHLFPGQ